MSSHKPEDRKRKNTTELSLQSLREMSTRELIEALKDEGVITEGGSLEKTLAEEEIDGDALAIMCSDGYKGLVDYGFKKGSAVRLWKLYQRLSGDKQKRPKNCRS